MEGSDDLYNASVSPSPKRKSTKERTKSKSSTSSAPRGQSSSTTRTNGNLGDYFPRTTPVPAPVARMTESSHSSQSPFIDRHRVFQTPASRKRRDSVAEPSPSVLRSDVRSSSKGKEEADFQADADKHEKARDRADPDFTGSQDTLTTKRTRKRRRDSEEHPTPSASRSRKGKQQRNDRSNQNGNETRRNRDDYIALIEENWKAPPNEWMPPSFQPRPKQKAKGKGPASQALELREWDEILLAELASLSTATRNRPSEAKSALQKAVSRLHRGGSGPILLPNDVQHAMDLIKTAMEEDASRSEAPVPSVFEDQDEEIIVGQPLNEPVVDTHRDEPEIQELSPHSPTFYPGVVEEEEIRPVLPVKRSVDDDFGWDDHNDAHAEYEALALQLQVDEAELQVKKSRLALKQKEIVLMRERARLRQCSRRDAGAIAAELSEE